MQLLPRGLGGGGGEKTAPPPETQSTAPPLLPKSPTATKPPVAPKPQVRIQTLHHHHVCQCPHSACPGACTSILYICVCVQLGWACTMCTYVNKPTRPGCEICGAERPEDYEVPNIYKPDQQEVLRIQQEQLSMLQYEQVAVLLIQNQAARSPETFLA